MNCLRFLIEECGADPTVKDKYDQNIKHFVKDVMIENYLTSKNRKVKRKENEANKKFQESQAQAMYQLLPVPQDPQNFGGIPQAAPNTGGIPLHEISTPGGPQGAAMASFPQVCANFGGNLGVRPQAQQQWMEQPPQQQVFMSQQVSAGADRKSVV